MEKLKFNQLSNKKRIARRKGRKLTTFFLCATTALAIGCAPLPKTIDLEPYKEEPEEIVFGDQVYKVYTDYERINGQAVRTFSDFVKTGADSSREMFLISLELLFKGKDPRLVKSNTKRLLKDPVYSEIRNAFKAKNPNGEVEEFLDQISIIRQNKDNITIWIRMRYGKDLVNAVLKHCN